ncbi:alpha/beta hydrolase [Mycolicibacterium duvalii]|nr:alpha/beta fold hydrolase [Mycolicibacterium duvalii]PEG40157.1 alpha/beta hydrolase [Mycolicibacterium duvalii]
MSRRVHSYAHDGLTFDVIDEGPLDGPVIIVLHGFPDRARNFGPLISALTAQGFRVLAPDQRGYSPGARPKGVRAYAIGRLTADIIALADQAEVTEFHVVGHDWGAVVAWELAASYPDRIATITALSVGHPRAFIAALVRGQIFRSWYMIAVQLPWLPERILGLLLRRRSAVPIDGVVEFWREPGAATAALNWYRAMLHRTSRTGRIRVPTLYVWSTGDPFLGRSAAQLTERHVKGPYRFVVLDGVSHWIPHERPDHVAAMLVAHITENGGTDAGADDHGAEDQSCSI